MIKKILILTAITLTVGVGAVIFSKKKSKEKAQKVIDEVLSSEDNPSTRIDTNTGGKKLKAGDNITVTGAVKYKDGILVQGEGLKNAVQGQKVDLTGGMYFHSKGKIELLLNDKAYLSVPYKGANTKEMTLFIV